MAAEPELSSNDTLTGLTAEAGRLQQQQRFDAVLDALGLQVQLARTLGNLDALGHGLVQTGSLRMLTGGYPEAGEAFAAAREAFVALEDHGEVAACDANLANLAYMQGRFAEAAENYQKAYEVFERLNEDARMASVLHGLGNALYMQTEFVRALDCYTRTITILQRTKDKYGGVERAPGDRDGAQGTRRLRGRYRHVAQEPGAGRGRGRRGGNREGVDGHRRPLPAAGRPRARAGTPDQGPRDLESAEERGGDGHGALRHRPAPRAAAQLPAGSRGVPEGARPRPVPDRRSEDLGGRAGSRISAAWAARISPKGSRRSRCRNTSGASRSARGPKTRSG